jgi:hypothetical protein
MATQLENYNGYKFSRDFLSSNWYEVDLKEKEKMAVHKVILDLNLLENWGWIKPSLRTPDNFFKNAPRCFQK